MPSEPWFTVAQAAEVCGVDASTVRRWLANDQIPGARRRGIEHWQPWEIPLDGLVKTRRCTADARPSTASIRQADARRALDHERELEQLRRRITELEQLVDRLESHCDRQQRLIDTLTRAAA